MLIIYLFLTCSTIHITEQYVFKCVPIFETSQLLIHDYQQTNL